LDHNAGRLTVHNGQMYGGADTYSDRGGFNVDKTREQSMSLGRRAVGSPLGLFGGAEANLQQGGRYPITGSMLSKKPLGGKRVGVFNGPDAFGLAATSPARTTLFTPLLSARGSGGGSMLGYQGPSTDSRINETRPVASIWDAAKNDLDGSMRSQIIQAQVHDSVVKMKAFANLGLAIK